MFRNRWQVLTAAALALAVAGPAWCVEGTVTHTLHLVHRQNVFLNDTSARIETHTLKQDMGFEIASNEEVRIVVDDPNPLLFTYTLNGIEKKDTQDFLLASQFAGQLQALGKVLGGVTDKGDMVALSTEMMTGGADLMERSLKSGTQKFSAAEKEKLKKYVEYIKREQSKEGQIENILDKYSINQDFFTTLGGDVLNLSSEIARIPALIEASAGDIASVQRVKAEVQDWTLKNLGTDLRDKLKQIDTVEFELFKVVGPVSVDHIDKVDSRLYAVLITKDQSSKVLDLLNTAETFATSVSEIDKQVEIARVPFSATQDATVSITIKTVEANSKIAEKTGRFHDTLKIKFSPRSPVHFGFGGAAVYSFVKKSEFKAETVNGQLKIVEKKGSDYFGQNIAAVLTITPRAWDDPIFGGQFQVGFNPKKDELAFFAGVGFRVFTLARIGVGLTYQQVPKLGSGLKVGDPLTATTDLKVDTEFRSGAYLFISVTTK
jgi:hypothetical protein